MKNVKITFPLNTQSCVTDDGEKEMEVDARDVSIAWYDPEKQWVYFDNLSELVATYIIYCNENDIVIGQGDQPE